MKFIIYFFLQYTSVSHVWENGGQEPTTRRPVPWRGLVMAFLLIIFGGLFILGGISIIIGLIRFEVSRFETTLNSIKTLSL